MKKFAAAAALVLLLAGCGPSAPEGPKRTASPAGAKVYFIDPKNGAEVTSPVALKFGIEGMEVLPAGTEKANSGHHHVLIDTAWTDLANPIPADDNHKHFGKGQTDTTLELKPGKHTLQLVLADSGHIVHDPVVQSEVITITVK